MGERSRGQLSLAESLVRQRPGQNERLRGIEALIDWGAVDKVLRPLRSRRGAPGYPALTLFKALLLQQWYGLPDPELEEALADRLSFRRFVGLSLDQEVPDHSTLWRFREALGRERLSRKVFAEIELQLVERGMIL